MVTFWRAFWNATRRFPWWQRLIAFLSEGLGWSVLALWDRFIRLPGSYRYLLAIGLLLLTCLVIYLLAKSAWDGEHEARIHLEDRLKPRLEILFDVHSIGDQGRTFYLDVNNCGVETISDVVLHLQSVEPMQQRFHSGPLVPLHQQEVLVNLHPEQKKRYLVCTVLTQGDEAGEIQIYFMDARRGNVHFPAGAYRFTLSAFGTDVLPVTKTYDVASTAEGVLSVRPTL